MTVINMCSIAVVIGTSAETMQTPWYQGATVSSAVRKMTTINNVSIKISNNYLNKQIVPLVEFMYLVFTHVPGESYQR